MTTFASLREIPSEPSRLYENARAQQIENDRQALQRAKDHRPNIPSGNARALKIQDETITRLQKIVDGAWLDV